MLHKRKKLVLAFIFDSSLYQVLLIHKKRPDWQKGKYNGIGGKVEIGETKLQAIKREVREETALQINDWTYFGRLHEEAGTIYLFTAKYSQSIHDAISATDEEIEWVSINKLPKTIISNLSWLIPMAKDKILNNRIKKVDIYNS